MLQRVQTLWMALTVAMVCIVVFMPVISFSAAGADFRLMTYGLQQTSGQVLVWEGEDAGGGIIAPMLSICLTAILGLAALVPFIAIFLFKKRQMQLRLLGAEFALLLGGAGLLAWYVFGVCRPAVAGYADNFFYSFFPLLLVVAMLTNWFAIRGVLHDEILVRAADRIR